MMNDVDLGEHPSPRQYPDRSSVPPESGSARPDPPERRSAAKPRVTASSPRDDTETGHAGDLPGIEEYKAQHGISGDNKDKRYWKFLYIGLVVLSAIVLVTVGVVIGRDTASPSTAGTNNILDGTDPPTPVPLPYKEVPDDPKSPVFKLVDFVMQQGWSKHIKPGSPQWGAANWLADRDEAKMVPSTDLSFKQRYVIAVLYFTWDGLNWPHETGWMTKADVCLWNREYQDEDEKTVKIGISCQEDGKAVTEIVLPGVQGYGEIPAEIGLLEDLVTLDLRHNKLTGGFPSEMVALSKLQTLIVEDNNFIGGIPAWLGEMTSLSKINLSRNKFAGHVPSTLKNLPLLHFLTMERNQLSGPLTQLTGLSSVQALLIGDNQFTGRLEGQLYNTWKQIQALDLSDNQLTGHIPEDIFAISSLSVLDLHGNHLSGPLPDLVSVNSNIEYLALQENNFTGTPGASLQLMEQLEHLDLSNNFFTGTMPTELAKLNRLRYLFLAFNEKFQFGTIPTEYGSLTSLVDLSLQKTNRVEKIPTELGQLSNLVLLDLNQNILTGSLPVQLGNLTNLKYLTLKKNKLEGSIPASYSQLVNLDTIIIDHNTLTGNAEVICDPKLPKLNEFMGTCRNFNCSCCSHCCTDPESDTLCNNVIWYAEQDLVYDEHYQFERWFYLFHESYVRYPVFGGGGI